jgi:ribose transport system permease protein
VGGIDITTETTRAWSLPRAFAKSDKSLLVLLVLLVLLIVVGGALVPHVFQFTNIANVLRNTSIVGLVAIGMTFVLLSGEIDLSVGSTMSLSLVVGGLVLEHGSGVALTATALTGLGLGVINGIAVGYARLSSLIVTLGTLAIFGGLAAVVSRGQAVYLYDLPAYTWTGKGAIAGVPFPFVVFVAVCVACTVLLALTKLGRHIYYTGASPVAAHYSGINVARTKVIVFAVSGLLAAMAGPLFASQTDRITPTQGTGFELAAIAIAVLGGTALEGARGTIAGTLVAALIYGFLLNVLALSGVGTYTEQVLKGCLLIVVVLLFQRLVFRRLRTGTG